MCIHFGMSRSEFSTEYQEVKPLHLKGAVCLDTFTWRDANELFERSDVASPSFKLSYEGIRPKHEYVERYVDVGTPRHRLIKPVVYDFLRKGATLIANRIKNEPKVSQFAEAVAQFTGRQVVSSAYVAFGNQSSFRCHWDTRDVFAIQLIGRKRWIVYEPSFDSPLYTQQSKDLEEKYPCPSTPYMDVVLEPGDVLYVPRGWWHNPLPIGEGSFHLALGTFPAYLVNYLEWATEKMKENALARRSMSEWEGDQDAIEELGQAVSKFLADPVNYGEFKNEFFSAQRVDSSLAMEKFGNPDTPPFNMQMKLSMCSHELGSIEAGYIVANGRTVRFGSSVARVLRCIADQPGINADEVLNKVRELSRQNLEELLIDMCRKDVLRIRETS